MKKVFFAVVAILMAFGAKAQIENPVRWSYAAKKVSATEAVVKDGGPVKTSFTFSPSKEYTPVGKTTEPAPISKFEKVFGMNVGYFENSVVFQQKVKLKSAKAAAVKGKLEYMVCNNSKCLPPEEVEFSIPLGK
jgi:hypothetical protein